MAVPLSKTTNPMVPDPMVGVMSFTRSVNCTVSPHGAYLHRPAPQVLNMLEHMNDSAASIPRRKLARLLYGADSVFARRPTPAQARAQRARARCWGPCGDHAEAVISCCPVASRAAPASPHRTLSKIVAKLRCFTGACRLLIWKPPRSNM